MPPKAIIPPKRHCKTQIDFDALAYKQRNVIERIFCRFKDWRRVAMRFDRNVTTFIAAIPRRYRHLVVMSPDPSKLSP